MQRSSVVLPEPLGPITTTTSPGATDRDTPRNPCTSPKDLLTPQTSSIGCGSTRRTSMALEDAPLELSAIESQGVADAEIDGCGAGKDLKRREGTLDDLAARHRQFPQSDDRHQRGRFDKADAEVDVRRCGQAQCLRQDDNLEHQRACHAEAA